MRPSLATDRISLGFWLNISFVVNHRGAFRSIIAFAIDLLTSEDQYFLWITAVPLPRRCLQSRQHSGSRMRRVTLTLSGPPNLRPELDHRYLIFLLFRQPITSPKLYLTSVRSVVLVKTQLQSIYSSRETWFFFSASARTSVLRGHDDRVTSMSMYPPVSGAMYFSHQHPSSGHSSAIVSDLQ